MVKFFFLPVCLLVALVPPARAEQVTLDLATGTKLTAEFAAPGGAKRGPAVIYLHGASVRDLGAAGAAGRGQDMAAFAAAFADLGFAAIAPIRRTPMEAANGDTVIDEGLAAILAATGFLQARAEVDPARIAVVGYGEGATIALWAAARMPDLAAAVAISPSRMSGRRSAAATMGMTKFLAGDGIAALRAPVLLIVGTKESRTTLRTGEELSVALMKDYKRFRYIRSFRADRRWFAAPRPDYLADVAQFLRDPAR